MIRKCTADDLSRILTIINRAAEAYREVIPGDCWHEPYMSQEELKNGLRSGILFSGFETDCKLVGVMGVQRVQDVTLIRHAYVSPDYQRQGIGSLLLTHCMDQTDTPLLVGTWADAAWAITFYQQHGFQLVPEQDHDELLQQYWEVPSRQRAASVVLGDDRWFSQT